MRTLDRAMAHWRPNRSPAIFDRMRLVVPIVVICATTALASPLHAQDFTTAEQRWKDARTRYLSTFGADEKNPEQRAEAVRSLREAIRILQGLQTDLAAVSDPVGRDLADRTAKMLTDSRDRLKSFEGAATGPAPTIASPDVSSPARPESRQDAATAREPDASLPSLLNQMRAGSGIWFLIAASAVGFVAFVGLLGFLFGGPRRVARLSAADRKRLSGHSRAQAAEQPEPAVEQPKPGPEPAARTTPRPAPPPADVIIEVVDDSPPLKNQPASAPVALSYPQCSAPIPAGAYAITARAVEGVGGMHGLAARVDVVKDSSINFGQKTLELGLRVLDAPPEVVVELGQTRRGAQLGGSVIHAQVGAEFEVFFRLLGATNAQFQVELCHTGGDAIVQAAVVDTRFAVTRIGARSTPSTPVSEETVTASRAWLAQLPSEEVRRVFEHLAQHGAITETEATAMLGGAREFRKFARELEQHAKRVPFRVRIESVSGVKRYVRDGDGA
jgi:hypothetical protein